MAEAVQSDLPLADVLVPVSMAPQLPRRVIQVNDFEPVQPDHVVERIDCRLIPIQCTQFVARGEDVARVQTHAQPVPLVRMIQQPGQMLERVAHDVAATGRRLEQHLRPVARGRRVGLPERLRDPLQTRFLARSSVRPRMQHEPDHPQRLTSLQLDDERVARPDPEILVRRGEVQQIRRVPDLRPDARLSSRLLELSHSLRRQRLRRPDAIGLHEELYRVAAHRLRALDRPVHPAGDRFVSTKSHWERFASGGWWYRPRPGLCGALPGRRSTRLL